MCGNANKKSIAPRASRTVPFVSKSIGVPLIKRLVDMGYQIYATRGTSTMLYGCVKGFSQK